ncbi:MAG TPA: hypothetical protein PKC21_09740 [Oligoflexia bacterium]|nr:hypothetical protein [Oligoflexia bacterium]HMR25620.1 hypothetical protein [Oligoflexia bacterium]
MKKSIDAIIKEYPDFKPMFERYWDATKEKIFLGSRALGLDADLNPLSPEQQVSFIVLSAKIYNHMTDISLENVKKQKLPALSDHERKFFGVTCDILRYQFTKALPLDEHTMTTLAQVCLYAPHQQDENLIKSVLKQLKAYVKKTS